MKTMFVRNTQPGPTVFDGFGEDSEALIWQGAGDPSGQDVLPVPSSLADNYAFHRELSLGIFMIEEADEEIAKTMETHKASWQRQMRLRNGASAAHPGEETAMPEFSPGGGKLPLNLMVETGVTTTEGEAKPKMTSARVVVGPHGGY